MQTFSVIFNIVFVVAGGVAFLWSLIGLLVGVVWLILHFVTKGHKLNKGKWFFVTFGGMVTLFVLLILFAFLFTILYFSGVNIPSNYSL